MHSCAVQFICYRLESFSSLQGMSHTSDAHRNLPTQTTVWWIVGQLLAQTEHDEGVCEIPTKTVFKKLASDIIMLLD